MCQEFTGWKSLLWRMSLEKEWEVCNVFLCGGRDSCYATRERCAVKFNYFSCFVYFSFKQVQFSYTNRFTSFVGLFYCLLEMMIFHLSLTASMYKNGESLPDGNFKSN